MLRYVLIAALSAVLGLLGWVWLLRSQRDSLEAHTASQARSIVALEAQAAQARLAAEVAKAAAERERLRAAEYDRLRMALVDGGEDVDLPDWFRDWVHALVGGRGVQPED